ncbi:MAG: cbb3-type cytochrome c oxidase subunit 3 [Myxococcales bacterium]|nr:cbb3-type cytochrome c oxidase subunit 3 [Myxococcales bacterium]
MSNMHLSHWAQIALVLFMAIFLGVVLYLVVFAKRETMDRMARMPLDETNGQQAKPNNGGGADE